MDYRSFDWQSYIENFVFGIGNREIQLLRIIADRYPINSVLDVACGEGIAAILLAGWGKEVTALDHDPDRISNNNSKSKSAGVNVNFCCADMRDLSRSYKKKCDLVLCLRDSLSRLMAEADIWGALVQMYLTLKPGGLIVIQTFDYDSIFATAGNKLENINENFQEGEAKITFHPGFEKTTARFIIESPERFRYRQGGKLEQHSIPVRPIYKKELGLWLAELGFKKVQALEEAAEKGRAGKTWNRVAIATRPSTTGRE